MTIETTTLAINSLSQAVDVRVQVTYLAQQSRPEDEHFVYGYTITISNTLDDVTVQLLDRHWLISDGENIIKEVKGPGVVGEQPSIAPHSSYTYSSGVVMAVNAGSMKGSYGMQSADGELFDVIIPEFALVPPNNLH